MVYGAFRTVKPQTQPACLNRISTVPSTVPHVGLGLDSLDAALPLCRYLSLEPMAGYHVLPDLRKIVKIVRLYSGRTYERGYCLRRTSAE